LLLPPRGCLALAITFRFFDIRKVFPANGLEQLSRGHIVLDEVMAGLYTLICLRLLLKLGWA
jgi:phosphatidylglycerophosphatase A